MNLLEAMKNELMVCYKIRSVCEDCKDCLAVVVAPKGDEVVDLKVVVDVSGCQRKLQRGVVK